MVTSGSGSVSCSGREVCSGIGSHGSECKSQVVSCK